MKFILRLIGFYINVLSIIAPKKAAKQTLHLFANPFKTKLKSEQQEYLNTSTQLDLVIDNKKVRYYKWGIGKEKILFVHGWQSNAYRWKSYIQSIDHKKYTLYAIDTPAHGNSEGTFCTVPLIEQSIQSLIDNEGKIDHIIAHSLGSFASASFLYHKKLSIKSFVSLAAPHNATEFFDDLYRRLKLSKKAMSYTKLYFKNYTTHEVSYYDQEKFLVGTNAEKILIVHDELDHTTSSKKSESIYYRLKSKKQKVELILTNGLGHNLRSLDLASKVIDFIQ